MLQGNTHQYTITNRELNRLQAELSGKEENCEEIQKDEISLVTNLLMGVFPFLNQQIIQQNANQTNKEHRRIQQTQDTK